MNETTGNEVESKAWASFDRWAKLMADKEIGFDQFAGETQGDFRRLARGLTFKKRIPAWWTVDDVYAACVTAAWHNFFVRAGGFDPTKYRSAGAWIRWKVRHRVMKDISKARGENQHTRQGSGRPEYLTKTGELPDTAKVDSVAECAVEIGRLARVCTAVREIAVLRAMVKGLGEKDAVVAFLLEDQESGIKDRRDANRAIAEFEEKAQSLRAA